MHIIPSKEAIAIYSHFKSLPGSEYIGKPVSIEALIGICRELKPKRILEMGGGIGTISYTLLKHSGAIVHIYEDNQYCIGELRNNLKKFEGRFQIINTYRILPPALEYDMVVIDGGNGVGKNGGYHLATQMFLLFLDSVKVVYIEGYRAMQRDMARKALRDKYICTFTIYKDVVRSGKKWSGGLKILCSKNKSAALRWSSYLFWEIIVRMRRIFFSLRALI